MARTPQTEHDQGSVDRPLLEAGWTAVRRRLSGHVRVTGFGLCVLALGLLIWARLMLVTSHPRTAIAEPQPEPAVQVVGAMNDDSAALPAH